MYRHLLVPIDGTELSTETVGQAADFARALKARITFLHAVPDHARSLSGDAEVVRVTAPEDYQYAYRGRAGELLAKAEAAARALGVPCSTRAVVSDSPHDAIIRPAADRARSEASTLGEDISTPGDSRFDKSFSRRGGARGEP